MSVEAIRTHESGGDDALHSLGQAGRDVALTLTRATYTSAYFMAYAAVFTGVLIVKAFPKRNPVAKGFRDGSRAARDVLEKNRARTARR
jgi:hypothetical protein